MKSSQHLPTLLHFSTKYGLEKLTEVLLSCPGGLESLTIRNCDGDTPEDLANKMENPHIMDIIVCKYVWSKVKKT